jgi:hypothetical protein|tara:strand:+ start:1139 stop:1378 length:240 start_codon:yes stop_codon:yes gene_type:complete
VEEDEIQRIMSLAEGLCVKIYSVLSDTEKEDQALVIALVWAALAVGLKAELSPDIIRVLVAHATESALEDYENEYETLH